jgi:hypothetical protein
MPKNAYDGPDSGIDLTGQHITESPVWGGEGETVDVTPDADGEISTVGEPESDAGDDQVDVVEPPAVDGQSTWADWEGSA